MIIYFRNIKINQTQRLDEFYTNLFNSITKQYNLTIKLQYVQLLLLFSLLLVSRTVIMRLIFSFLHIITCARCVNIQDIT